MIDPPGEHPPPHPELHSQHPLIWTLLKGTVLYRHHQKIHDPVFFGRTGNYRFDDPDSGPGGFGVLYAGADPECCLLESCGPTTGVPAVSGAYLDARSIARLELMQDLSVIDLVEPGLGGHLKTGHRWTLQNRPTGQLNQDKIIYNLEDGVRSNGLSDLARLFYTDLTWAEDTATQGCDRSADQRPEWSGAASVDVPPIN